MIVARNLKTLADVNRYGVCALHDLKEKINGCISICNSLLKRNKDKPFFKTSDEKWIVYNTRGRVRKRPRRK